MNLFIDSYFPDGLPDRVLLKPTVFEVWPEIGDCMGDSSITTIGSTKIRFDFDIDEAEPALHIIMTCVLPFVLPSVTAIRLGYSGSDEEEWAGFLNSQPEVRSIECSKDAWDLVSDSLWGVLSPKTGTIPLCRKLESISVYTIPDPMPLLHCLRNRRNAGFGLRHLKLLGVDDQVEREFRSLVEELQVFSKPVDEADKVSRSDG